MPKPPLVLTAVTTPFFLLLPLRHSRPPSRPPLIKKITEIPVSDHSSEGAKIKKILGGVHYHDRY